MPDHESRLIKSKLGLFGFINIALGGWLNAGLVLLKDGHVEVADGVVEDSLNSRVPEDPAGYQDRLELVYRVPLAVDQ